MISETINQTTFIYPSDNVKNYWDEYDKQNAIKTFNHYVENLKR